MRPGWSLTSLGALCVLLGPAGAFAQSETKTSSVTERDLAALKARLKAEMRLSLEEELREELKRTLKDELKTELKDLAPAPAATTPDGGDIWAEEEWKWEEPLRPELNFLQLDGYFRFRYQMFNKLDLNSTYFNTDTQRLSGPFAQRFVPGTDGAPGSWLNVQAPLTPLCSTDVNNGDNNLDQTGRARDQRGCREGAGDSDTLGGANMRLRLEPVLNVYEDVKIKMQIDVLDNLVLGSTPDGFPLNPISPLLAFSQTQVAPSDGINSVWTDSIRVKRAWAEIMTPIGQLRVGRMPAQFGSGLFLDEGRGINADFGNTVDRIMFATKIGDFYLAPAFDWAASGPTSAIRNLPYGQPFDRDQRDDVDQYVMHVIKEDPEEEAEQKLAAGDFVLDFGTYQSGRFQALDSVEQYVEGVDPSNLATTTAIVERDASVYMYSYWVRFQWQKLKIEAEYAGAIGTIGNVVSTGEYGPSREEINRTKASISQHGAIVNTEYKLLDNALTLQLLVVVASGDSSPGWGIRPLLQTDGSNGVWDGSQLVGDSGINNFRANANLNVDLIFWRQIVGQVTDALVVRPSVQYEFTDGLGARLDLVFSRALRSASTPSGSFSAVGDFQSQEGLGSPNNNLGLEGDLKLFYETRDGFFAWAQYGLFIPFAGLDREVIVEENSVQGATNSGRLSATNELAARIDASIAHTIQFLLGVQF